MQSNDGFVWLQIDFFDLPKWSTSLAVEGNVARKRMSSKVQMDFLTRARLQLRLTKTLSSRRLWNLTNRRRRLLLSR